ncbi:MAG: OB-fold nucleic acid binding domain-containing protein [Candidatus Aenigmatarchaeota archaeon]
MELKRLDIESLLPGMQNVDIIGMIIRMSKKDFATEKAKGSLANVTVSDNTGSIRLVLWNDEIKYIDDFMEGDVVAISGYIRQGIFGPELRLGKFGKIEKSSERVNRRSSIVDLREGQRKEIRATLVQVFESSPFYEVCKECGTSLKEDGENFVCPKHGNVEPSFALRVGGIIDDGTSSLRFIAFTENAEKILGMGPKGAQDIVLRKGMPALFSNAKLGEYVFEGNVRRNKLFDRLEFSIQDIKEVNVDEEIEMMIEK